MNGQYSDLALFKSLVGDDPDTALNLAAQMFRVPLTLAQRVQQQESGGKQGAISPKGAIGRMQLMPDTAKTLGVNPHDEIENIWGGMKYLGDLLGTFGGSVPKALAAYNWGPKRVEQHGLSKLPRETLNFLTSILGPRQVWAAESPPQHSDEELFKSAGLSPTTKPTGQYSDEDLAKIAGIALPAKKAAPAPPQAAPRSAMQYIEPSLRQIFEIGGLLGGGFLGAASGPPGAIAGAGLGYGIGRKAAQAFETYAMGRPAPTLKQSLVQTAKDVPTGAVLEATGQAFPRALSTVGTKVIQPIMGRLAGMGTWVEEQALKRTPNFLAALRGKVSGEEVVDYFKGALEKVKNFRRQDYLSKLTEIRANPAQLSEVRNKLLKETNKLVSPEFYGIEVSTTPQGSTVVDFSQSSIVEHQAAVRKALEDITGWTDHSAHGLDVLKKRLSDYINQTGRNTPAEKLLTQLRNNLARNLESDIPGYGEMTKAYAKSSHLIRAVESALSMKEKGGVWNQFYADRTLRKLMSAMRQDREIAHDIINVFGHTAEEDLAGMTAGYMMRSPLPVGLSGTAGLLIGEASALKYLSPKFLPVLLASSPRIQGEFLALWGKGLQEFSGLSEPMSKAMMKQLGDALRQEKTQTQKQGQNQQFLDTLESLKAFAQ